jgi:hypothetical protein
LGNGNNGNVWGITNNRDTSRNQSFTYDPLNRLISAQNAGTDCTKPLPDGHTEYWGNNYSYDAWGNLQKTPTKCSAENLSVGANANNQLQDPPRAAEHKVCRRGEIHSPMAKQRWSMEGHSCHRLRPPSPDKVTEPCALPSSVVQ